MTHQGAAVDGAHRHKLHATIGKICNIKGTGVTEKLVYL